MTIDRTDRLDTTHTLSITVVLDRGAGGSGTLRWVARPGDLTQSETVMHLDVAIAPGSDEERACRRYPVAVYAGGRRVVMGRTQAGRIILGRAFGRQLDDHEVLQLAEIVERAADQVGIDLN